MKTLLIVMSVMITVSAFATTKAPSYDQLIAALIVVESNGNDRAIGDPHKRDKAYGPLQIRQPCVDDVNRRYGTKIKAEELLGNRQLSIWVCAKYLEMYGTPNRLGKEPSLEDLARVWNGGPSGHRKQATLAYWSKVQRALKN